LGNSNWRTILETKPVRVSFDGEDVSGNGGILLTAQVEKLTGLIAGAAGRLKDHRTQSLIKHSEFERMVQRVYQIIAGFSAGADSNFLRYDPTIKTAVGRNPVTGAELSSQASQSRLGGRGVTRSCTGFASGLWTITSSVIPNRQKT
jgi:hypothetical protein